MKHLAVALAVALSGPGGMALADEFRSGLQVGEKRGCLQVEWIIAFPGEGKYGPGCMPDSLAPAAPVAIIFTQKVDERVAALVREVEPRATEWLDNRGPKAFVCGVGGLRHEDLRKLGKVSDRVPLTIAADYQAAQTNLRAYKLDKDAAVTVIVYDDKLKVTANFAFRDTKDLTREKIGETVTALAPGARR